MDLPPALSFFGTICEMNPILPVLIIGAVIYLLVVLYKIIKPEFSNAKAKPIRPLNDIERKELEDYFQGPKEARKNIRKYLVVFSAAFAVGFMITALGLEIDNFIGKLFQYLGAIVSLTSFVFVISTFVEVNKTYYLSDLKSPVHRIEGKVFKGMYLAGNRPTEIWTFKIGKYSFDVDEKYKAISKDLKDGYLAAVEFSPRSKKIWKIEKL